MSEDSMLICLIAFVLGYLVARMMRGNGLSVGGQNEQSCIPTGGHHGHHVATANKNWNLCKELGSDLINCETNPKGFKYDLDKKYTSICKWGSSNCIIHPDNPILKDVEKVEKAGGVLKEPLKSTYKAIMDLCQGHGDDICPEKLFNDVYFCKVKGK